MDNKRQKIIRRAGIGTGTISLLVIFTVLCMATLALLSVTTAASNRRINQRSFTGVHSLTQTEGKSAEKIAEIDLLLAQAYAKQQTEQEYYAFAMQQLTQKGYTVDTDKEIIVFSLPIDDRHSLVTELQITFPPNAAARYRMVSQVAVLVGEWTPEEDGKYWSGT